MSPTDPPAEAEAPATPALPDALPILPLSGAVVFPMAAAPLSVGQPRSVQLVDDAMRSNRMLGLFAQRTDGTAASASDLHRVGTAAVIHQLLRAQDGTLRLVVQGVARIRFTDLLRTDPYLVARVERAPDAPAAGIEVEALARTARELFERLVGQSPELPDELAAAARALQDPVAVAYLIGATMPMPPADRQAVLEADAPADKLRRLVDLLQHELAVQDVERQINRATRVKLEREQRDHLLRERMQAIQRELGEDDPERAEAQELRSRFEEAHLSEEARREAERELSRLERLPAASPEHGVARGYLEWILALPWGKTTGGAIDVPRARQVLDEDHYDVEAVKDRILEYLAVKKLRDERRARTPLGGDGSAGLASHAGPVPQTEADEERREPILCFVGPPGVGKTSLGHSIARALGRTFIRISLGGVHDEAEIRGHRRTYIGAMPGRIIQALRRAGTSDPVFMLDEVDKLGAGFHGDPASALLEVLDPAQNQHFADTFLGVAFDLSQVMFICTANTVDTIPAPLLDRMELLALSGYTEMEKLHIARRHLLPKLIEAHGLRPDEVKLDDAAILQVTRAYTREAGVRGLERQLATLLRKVARRIGEGQAGPVDIGPAQVRELLGRPRVRNETVERIDRPGVATGLAWTPTGGELLFVEATLMPGEEKLILTGMLGDVMRESAQAALSYLRSNAERLGIDPAAFERRSVHVHVPQGAIPKDGPSAGVTILTALASLGAGRPVKADLAMTGEITLRGRVLPVGGIKEKVLGAYRAGVKTVILPRANDADLEDVPEEVRRAMSFVPVDSAEEVLRAALEPGERDRPAPPPPEQEQPAAYH